MKANRSAATAAGRLSARAVITRVMYRGRVNRALRSDCLSAMKRAGLVVLAGILVAASAALGRADGARVQDATFHAYALGGDLGFEVYLPAGYDRADKRYPVIYFLHGLPANGSAYRGVGFVEHALDVVGRPAILVVPQGARDDD